MDELAIVSRLLLSAEDAAEPGRMVVYKILLGAYDSVTVVPFFIHVFKLYSESEDGKQNEGVSSIIPTHKNATLSTPVMRHEHLQAHM